MWNLRTYLLVGAAFATVSAIIYSIHYATFQDANHIFIYMIGDLAFLPLEAFLVVIVIERVLAGREKRAIRQKMNMVVGAFFSEVGTQLLHSLLTCFQGRDEISRRLAISRHWTRSDFREAVAFARTLQYTPDCRSVDLDELKRVLVSKRTFLLGLLENPNILEQDRFTDLLWATFHLTEELEARKSLVGLPESDLNHISVDIERLYTQLAAEWVAYAEHLQASYPFLFSLVTRMHPFQEHPSPVVSE